MLGKSFRFYTIIETRKKKIIAWLEKRHAFLHKREEQLTAARVGCFLGGLALVTVLVAAKSVAAPSVATFLVAAFLLLVLWHSKIAGALRRHSIELELWKRSEARSNRNWEKLPALPLREKLPRYYSDLDLVGDRSLLRLIQSGISVSGYHALVSLFSSSQEIPLRQLRVKALAKLKVLRRRLLRESQLGAGALLDLQEVEQFLAPPFHTEDARKWVMLLGGLQALAALMAVLYVATPFPPIYVVPWFLSFIVFSFTYPKFFNPFGRAVTVENTLQRFRSILRRVESFRLSPENPLKDLFSLFQGEERPSQRMKELSLCVSLLSIRSHPFLYVLIHMVFPWDFVVGLRLEKLRDRLRKDVVLWIQAFAHIEALLSLAEFADAFPSAMYPQVLSAERKTPLVRAFNLKHPLISEQESVGNEAELNDTTWCRLITGSNMSGKSTYLRTLGVNLLLAQAGAPVFAERFEFSPCRVFTLLRVADSLEDHVSSFYAEVKVLKEILEEASREGAPVLYLIDEIFRGTNNRERLVGSRAYLKRILLAHAGGLVATHDLELAEIASSEKGIQNFHFKESISAGEMHFSYQLEKGPCPTTNALKIMELAGLPT